MNLKLYINKQCNNYNILANDYYQLIKKKKICEKTIKKHGRHNSSSIKRWKRI